ncbi:MAG: EF-hand domain-containing protein [Cyanobacteria bacterium P01_A01_bin.123]
MKRFLLSSAAILIATATIAPVAVAGQTDFHDLKADLNGDGEVSLTELRRFNRSARRS